MSIENGGPSSGGRDDYGAADSGGGNVRRRFGPPPAFLTKTFHMVNEPNTTSIVSWSKLGDSFIIWDHIKFSAEILPNYFRHNNFSSFVYQLNNYGFRKIGVDHQWEYSSPYFQEGKGHLLSNMKRRTVVQKPSSALRKRSRSLSPETLSKSMEESKQELKKLKKQQSEMEFHIMRFKEKANNLEAASKKMVVQWAKACEIMVERERARARRDEKAVVVVEDIDAVSLAGKDAEKAMVGDYSVELDNLKKRLLQEDDDEVFEVGDPNMRNAIAQDFQEWLIEDTTLFGC